MTILSVVQSAPQRLLNFFCSERETITLLKFIHGDLSMKISELATELNAAEARLLKVRDELIAKLNELEAALESVEVPEEVSDALDSLTFTIASIDDIVPDSPPPTTQE